MVFADKEHLNIVLRNLINNAIKFSNEGSNIYIDAGNMPDDTVMFSVKDEGIGISPDRLDKLFTVESGFSTFGTKNEKGTGLGLQLCKEYIEMNNGKIYIESNTGKGTTISFSLPKTER